ncbi:putative disease resistance RPP13-like protein 2 isoform X2 [Rhodamnia argentea]|uniref:Disease resistance RPP13-like protein 2 isoform X2 n=1 Tax=Rhodamnia argentea TaxID=178133 RepID=A0ABM3GXK5_9MYRT|nr:putative disease resistance RPP13-like protein 2 isoform X2 [Rhodamnia argentea]
MEAELSGSPTPHTTAMAAEVAISLGVRNSLHVLAEGKILSSGLRDQINMAVNELQNKFSTLKLPDGSGLLDRARVAVDLADRFLLKASQHLKSHKGRLAKIRALVHFMTLWIRVRATERTARDFITGVKELSTHLSQMQDLSRNGSSRNAHRGKVRWNGKVESDIVGREDEARRLLDQLIVKDGDQDALRLRVISVVGKEAIGKTALVRSVYSSLEVDHSFHCRVWVRVPEKFTPKDLLVKILKQTPQKELKDIEHKEEEELKEILHKSLMELRYLIVFDNLRKAEDMDELMILLADARNGSRVIVTTPVPEIPSRIDPWASPLELHKLDANQSEDLLREWGSVAEDPEREDPELKARILNKCSGSPLGILVLAGLVAASSDSSPVNVDQLTDNSTLRDIVCLSYHKLPSLLKLCLLYLCLFPKDCEISTRRLFQLWLAEGLVQPLEHTTAHGDEKQVPGSKAMECFNQLVGRNLVHVVRRRRLSGWPKSCRVPSFLHDFLCETATQLRLLQIRSNNRSEESKVVNGCSSWIVKYEDDDYRQESQQVAKAEDHQLGSIQLQHVRSYVSFNTQKRGTRLRDIEELIRQLTAKGDTGLLRVLDLEGVYKPLLPDRLGNVLPNLRYLGLRWTVLDSIPESVANMSRLETLDLKHTNVRNLPSWIWEGKSLQHLYMNEVCFDESTIPHKPSSTTKHQSNLQTLWGLYIGAVKSPMFDVLSKLTRLEKLGLTCNSQVVEKATECISNLPMLRSLKLRSRDLFGQPSDLNLSSMTGLESVSHLYLLGGLSRVGLSCLPRNLKILTLSMSGLKDDPMRDLGKLKSLEILNLFAGSYTGSKLYWRADSFPRLRVLKLWKLEGLKKAFVRVNALPCLEELEIKDCGLLTSFASLGHVASLQQISLIKVRTKLAEEIKSRLTPQVFIKEKQLVISSSSSSSTEVIFRRLYAFFFRAFPHLHAPFFRTLIKLIER